MNDVYDEFTLGISKDERDRNIKWHAFISLILSVILAYIIIAIFDVYVLKKQINEPLVIKDHIPFVSDFKLAAI